MIKQSLALIASTLLVTACGMDPELLGSGDLLAALDESGAPTANDGDSSSDGNTDGSGGWDNDDCKIEDGDLGRTDLTLDVGGSRVRVSSWQQKDGEPGEYVGFTLDVDGEDVEYTVKAGTDRFPGSGAEWSHPNGTGGPNVHGISHVDFCDNCVPGEPCGPSAGEGEGEGEPGGGEGEGEGEPGGGEGEGEGECIDAEACGGGNGGEGEGEPNLGGVDPSGGEGEGEGENTGGGDPSLGGVDIDGDGEPEFTGEDCALLDPETGYEMCLDTDGDGIPDEHEPGLNADALDPDTDDDGIPDGEEVFIYGTDPGVADSDGDGLDDGTEIEVTGTDPLDPDTDGGGVSDGDEVNTDSTDPLDPSDDGDGGGGGGGGGSTCFDPEVGEYPC